MAPYKHVNILHKGPLINITGVVESTCLNHEAQILFSASRFFDDAAENWLIDTLSTSACKGLRVSNI